MFPEPRPADLITVPACQQCNQGFSKEDEYFRIAVLGPAALKESTARALWDGPVVRGLRRSILERESPFAIEFAKSLKEFKERDSAGQVIGTTSARKISKERLDSTVKRIVQGLVWWEYDEHLLPDDVTFDIEAGRVRGNTEELAQRVLNRGAVGHSVAGGIFQYWHHAAQGDPNRSDWLLTFYRAFGFLVHLTPRA